MLRLSEAKIMNAARAIFAEDSHVTFAKMARMIGCPAKELESLVEEILGLKDRIMILNQGLIRPRRLVEAPQHCPAMSWVENSLRARQSNFVHG